MTRSTVRSTLFRALLVAGVLAGVVSAGCHGAGALPLMNYK